jgi:hypothetical protein
MRTKFVMVALMSLAVAMPAFAKTYKNTYPVTCSRVWDAVKVTLGDTTRYKVEKSDDTQMTASYQPKHSVHVDVSGVLLQRMNHVTLIAKGEGCEMDVVSNFSGWGHEDQGDFKKRVDEALIKPKEAAEVAKPAPAAN